MIFRFIRYTVKLAFYFGILLALAGSGIGYFYYKRLTKELPRIEKISDYRPKAVSTLYAADGTLLAEIYDEERRYPVEMKDIPLRVRNAFLAAEDANFYRHPGIDVLSILRATWVNFRHKAARQGASTITQQIVKSLLLTREKTFDRKIKEAILSYRLEKFLSKDEILSVYLNEVYLGETAYGVKAAAKVFFHKELSQLSIAEAAFIAGMPQKPSELSRPDHRDDAMRRQNYVIDQMLKNGMINAAEADLARKEKLTIYSPEEQTIFQAPYFAGHAIKNMGDVFAKIDPKLSATNPGGFKITTTVDLRATALAEKAVFRGLREVDKRRGWRGPIELLDEPAAREFLKKQEQTFGSKPPIGKVLRAVVLKIGPESGVVTVACGGYRGEIDLKKAGWAKKIVQGERVSFAEPARLLRAGSVIEVTFSDEPPAEGAKAGDAEKADGTAAPAATLQVQLDQTPDLEAAFVVLNAQTGSIAAMIGGFDYQRSQFNRVTLARRQPGSSFKPLVYLAALEALNYTASTIVPDSPISMVAGDGKLWTPGNFDGKFLGPITLRTALQRSRNVVSVFLIQKLGMDRVIETAQRLGLTTPLPKNLSIALGSAEVEMLQLVRAYGTFATEGWLAEPMFVSSIRDRNDKVIYEAFPRQRRVVAEDDAFLMAHLMKGVIDRGTATVLKKLGRPIAGKTGTTNDHMDCWFIGYTPEWVSGVWVGFDRLRSIGKEETGGRAAAPIFLYFMEPFLAGTPIEDFEPTDGVYPVPVELESGRAVSFGDSGAFIEYFKSGTEPGQVETESAEAAPQDYLSNSEF